MRISDWSSDVCSSDLRAVDGDRAAAAAGEVHRRLADGQMKVGAREHLGLPERLQRPRATGPPPHAGDGTTNRQSLHKTATRQIRPNRSEEHTSELQSLMRISYAVFCLKKKKQSKKTLVIVTTIVTQVQYIYTLERYH